MTSGSPSVFAARVLLVAEIRNDVSISPHHHPTPLNNSLLDLGDQGGRGYICRRGEGAHGGHLNLHLTRVNSAGDKASLISDISILCHAEPKA